MDFFFQLNLPPPYSLCSQVDNFRINYNLTKINYDKILFKIPNRDFLPNEFIDPVLKDYYLKLFKKFVKKVAQMSAYKLSNV